MRVTSQPILVTHQPIRVTCQQIRVTCQPISVTYQPLRVTYQPISVMYHPIRLTCQPVNLAYQPIGVTCQTVSVTYQPILLTFHLNTQEINKSLNKSDVGDWKVITERVRLWRLKGYHWTSQIVEIKRNRVVVSCLHHAVTSSQSLLPSLMQ